MTTNRSKLGGTTTISMGQIKYNAKNILLFNKNVYSLVNDANIHIQLINDYIHKIHYDKISIIFKIENIEQYYIQLDHNLHNYHDLVYQSE